MPDFQLDDPALYGDISGALHLAQTCNDPKHVELLRRAEAAEERCRTLEGRIKFLEAQPSRESTEADALEKVLQYTLTPLLIVIFVQQSATSKSTHSKTWCDGEQERADTLGLELAMVSQQAEVLQQENQALQGRTATLENELAAARGTLAPTPRT